MSWIWRLSRPCLSTALVRVACGLVSAGPVITSMDPTSGPAGTLIRLEGKDLKTTRHVVFAVGSTVTSARFRALGEGALEVVAPEYYRQGAAGTVAVFTRLGVTVAMPADVRVIDRERTQIGAYPTEPGRAFYHVLDGGSMGIVPSPGVIESGGKAVDFEIPGMAFVKSGGRIEKFYNSVGVLFHEPGALFGDAILRKVPRQGGGATIPVGSAEITVSPNVGPFLFEAPKKPNLGEARPTGDDRGGAPLIRTVEPWVALRGEVVTLGGRNLGRTTHAYFVSHLNLAYPSEVSYRIVSDLELKLQVPDLGYLGGPISIIVVAADGATVTLPRNNLHRDELDDRTFMMSRMGRPLGYPSRWVGAGQTLDPNNTPLVYVDHGGSIRNLLAAQAALIKGGGHVVESRSRNDQQRGSKDLLIVEPGADLPEDYRSVQVVREVGRIEPSYLPTSFHVDIGPSLLLKSGTPVFEIP